ncbi:MAG: rhodanese-like domain-containing protein [Brumimicrobium sp.]|nr:rhodanese-like domain-containing protein [Brumimicrobium sp.]
MFDSFKKLLGLGPKKSYKEMCQEGAIILDVRTKGEFSSGCIKKSVNIPVEQLEKNLSKLKDKDQVIICCCASGMRSGMAKRILKSHGYQNVYNGGGWMSLRGKI